MGLEGVTEMGEIKVNFAFFAVRRRRRMGVSESESLSLEAA
jgi:hypothetical protein